MDCPNALTARWINVSPTDTIMSCDAIGSPVTSVFHLFLVARPIALCHHHAVSGRETRCHREKHKNKTPRRSHGGKRRLPREVSHDNGVHRAVKLLQQGTSEHGKHEF